MYLIAFFAFATEFNPATQLLPLIAVPFLSRCLSGIATVFFDPGTGKGMLFEFYNSANRRNVLAILVAMTIACAIYLVAVNPLVGICMLCVAAACLVGLYFMSDKAFCGMSGDLAGFFLQICELALLICIVTVGKI